MIPDEAVEAAWRASLRNDLDSSDIIRILEAAVPYLSEAARQPQRMSPTDWPDVPRLP